MKRRLFPTVLIFCCARKNLDGSGKNTASFFPEERSGVPEAEKTAF